MKISLKYIYTLNYTPRRRLRIAFRYDFVGVLAAQICGKKYNSACHGHSFCAQDYAIQGLLRNQRTVLQQCTIERNKLLSVYEKSGLQCLCSEKRKPVTWMPNQVHFCHGSLIVSVSYRLKRHPIHETPKWGCVWVTYKR